MKSQPRQTSTIVYTHGGGRFANQLMVFSHLIALAEEHRELRIVNYAFWPFASLCAGTENNPRCEYPHRAGDSPGLAVHVMSAVRAMVPRRRRNAAQRVIGHMLHKLMPWRSLDYIEGAPEVDIGATEFLDRVRARPRVLLAGWRLRNWDLFARHQEAVRRFLMPASRFQPRADAFVNTLRQRHQKLIGVLIRQDDYRYWANGMYFFTSEQYRTFIGQLRERFGPDAAIVVATDEKQPAGIFDGLGVTWCTGEQAGSGHYLESFLELAQCDVIASAPSTFSAWAAFFGEKPLLPIGSASDDLREARLLTNHLLDAHRDPIFRSAVQ